MQTAAVVAMVEMAAESVGSLAEAMAATVVEARATERAAEVAAKATVAARVHDEGEASTPTRGCAAASCGFYCVGTMYRYQVLGTMYSIHSTYTESRAERWVFDRNGKARAEKNEFASTTFYLCTVECRNTFEKSPVLVFFYHS